MVFSISPPVFQGLGGLQRSPPDLRPSFTRRALEIVQETLERPLLFFMGRMFWRDPDCSGPNDPPHPITPDRQ
jgi:hypothetical protein